MAYEHTTHKEITQDKDMIEDRRVSGKAIGRMQTLGF